MKHVNNIYVEPYTSRLIGTNPRTGENFMIITKIISIIDKNIGSLHTEVISVDFIGSVPPIDIREDMERTIRQMTASKEFLEKANKEYRKMRYSI